MRNLRLYGDWGELTFRVAIAQTPEQIERGLMFVKDLAKNSGMLFVYPWETKVWFWMKNTFIPLDMLFFNSKGKMTKLHKDAKPHDLTPKHSESRIKYVLELNGGTTDKHNISQNTFMDLTKSMAV